MKKENLKWILNPMSEREMRLVKGREGLDTQVSDVLNDDVAGGAGVTCSEGDPCKNKASGDACTCNGKAGYCWAYPFAGMKCKLG